MVRVKKSGDYSHSVWSSWSKGVGTKPIDPRWFLTSMVLTVFAKVGCVFPSRPFDLNSTWPSIEATTIVKTNGVTHPLCPMVKVYREPCLSTNRWWCEFLRRLLGFLLSKLLLVQHLKNYKFTHPNFLKLLPMKTNLIVSSSDSEP